MNRMITFSDEEWAPVSKVINLVRELARDADNAEFKGAIDLESKGGPKLRGYLIDLVTAAHAVPLSVKAEAL